MKQIGLIDGNSLINRAYYAMRNPMITKTGIYTHGIFGFLNMMEKLRKDYSFEYMAIAFDMKAPTFRHQQYDEYKAGRKKMPEELSMQIPLLKDILDAMGIRRIEVEGYEADDIIGTLAKKGEEAGLEPIIVTGDRDQLQLATEVTKVVYTKRGVSEFDLYDREAFQEAYGFTPLQFIDYKGLAGDSSDNIPGIPGVGAKTATKLIQEYGSVENIIASVDSIKPAGLQKKVAENATQAMMSKKLATIMTFAPVEVEIEDCIIGEADYDRLIEIYKKLEFNRFLSRLKVQEKSGAAIEVGPEPDGESGTGVEATAATGDLLSGDGIERIIVRSDSILEGLSLEKETVLKVFGDNSHVGKPEIEGIALMTDELYIYVDVLGAPDVFSWLKDQVNKGVGFLGHNLKESYFMVMSMSDICLMNTIFDTQVAQYVIDPARSNYEISALSNEYIHKSIVSEEEFAASNSQMDMFTDRAEVNADYGFQYCLTIMNLRRIQEESLKGEGLEGVFYEVELPLIEPMAAMEVEGFRVNREFLESFGAKLTEEIDALASSIHQMAGESFNINSPVQLGTILFEKLELTHGKKTKRGYSTSAEVLEKIAKEHPIVPAILEYRSLTKLKSTYIDGLIPLIGEDGKIRAHFQQTVTATGRISCTEPNLQNIPIRQELGRQLRKAFVPEEDSALIGADYSQIELRVLAHMAQDDTLIDAFNRGEDIHRATAANVLGVPEDEITPLERSRAKAVNFGVIYGMSAFGLSGELDISRKDAESYINAYFDRHYRVKAFMDESVSQAKDKGYVTTMMGRKRYIKEINASNYMVRQIGERLAMNTPIQGSAADIIKIAMVKVYKALIEEKLQSKLILQIHDELIINAKEEEKERVKRLLTSNMEKAVKLAVELKAECNEGNSWYDLK